MGIILEKKVTLMDIAKIVGVTPSTVQRALKGADGVGEEQRKRIKQVAKELNYRPNMLASTLKKGGIEIAVILPTIENENKYYAASLWEGVYDCLEGYSEYMIKAHKVTYERAPRKLGEAIQKVYEEYGSQISGVITMGTEDNILKSVCEQLDEKQIPYVFVGTDNNQMRRLCCITACNEIAGKMAADLLLNFLPLREGKIIMTGDFSIEDQNINALGFEKQMREQKKDFEIIKLSNYKGIESTGKTIAKFLASDMDIVGIYSSSARNTLAVSQATQGIKRQIMTVGSDIFQENIRLIEENKVSAIIHKRPYEQAFQATQILIEYIMKGKKPTQRLLEVVPFVVTNGNIECFKEHKLITGSYIL